MADHRCAGGHAMIVTSTFLFDHEPGDSARDAIRLDQFKALGVELGAQVTVWECPRCNVATAEFVYLQPPPERGVGS